MFDACLGYLSEIQKISQPYERRCLLLARMTELGQQHITCHDCTGVCCSFVANSMMTTPLESADLLFHLDTAGRVDQELVVQLQSCVTLNRLAQPVPADGRRSFLRRTYTCPFYAEGGRGCAIDPVYKPYGCLGFNATCAGVTAGGSQCCADLPLLQMREQATLAMEADLNAQIRHRLNLSFEKLPMPHALLLLLGVGDR